MRLLVVAPEWPPEVVGGGGQVYERVARFLAIRGHRITVVHGGYSNRNPLAKVTSWTADGLSLWRVPLLPTPNVLAWLRTALPPTPTSLSSLRKILDQRWDVAHLHGVGFPLVDFAARQLIKSQTPYVVTIHGVPASPEHRGLAWRIMWHWYCNMATRATLRGAQHITAVSQSLLREPLLSLRDGTTIYNGLPITAYVASDHAVPSTKPKLVSISRLSRNKGLDVAIRALSELANDGVDAHYDIYGPAGGEERSLRRLVQDLRLSERVRFMGAFPPSQRQRILSGADLLVVPSRVEGFGIVALEGLAAGVPVVATRVDGLAEFLNDDCAALAAPEDVAALCRSMRAALQVQARKRLIANGRAVAERFRWDNLLRQYEEVLIEAAGCAK